MPDEPRSGKSGTKAGQQGHDRRTGERRGISTVTNDGHQECAEVRQLRKVKKEGGERPRRGQRGQMRALAGKSKKQTWQSAVPVLRRGQELAQELDAAKRFDRHGDM